MSNLEGKSKRVAKAIDFVRMNTPICRIEDVAIWRDFVEIYGYADGEVCIYRVYNDGRITEK